MVISVHYHIFRGSLSFFLRFGVWPAVFLWIRADLLKISSHSQYLQDMERRMMAPSAGNWAELTHKTIDSPPDRARRLPPDIIIIYNLVLNMCFRRYLDIIRHIYIHTFWQTETRLPQINLALFRRTRHGYDGDGVRRDDPNCQKPKPARG